MSQYITSKCFFREEPGNRFVNPLDEVSRKVVSVDDKIPRGLLYFVTGMEVKSFVRN